MPAKLASIVITVSILWASCPGCGPRSSHGVTTTPLSVAGSRPRGIVYSLPKRVLRLTITYTRRGVTVVENGVPQQELGTVYVTKPIKIEPLLVADERHRLLASSNSISDNAMLESGLTFSVAENGVLMGVVSDVKDERLDTFKELFSAGIAIAKTAASLGDDPLRAQIRKRYGAIVRDADTESPLTKDQFEKLAKAKAELELLLEVAKLHRESNFVTIRETEREYVVVVDPEAHITKNTKGGLEPLVISIEPGDLFSDGSTIPTVTVTLACTSEHLRWLNEPNEKIEGISYRVPVEVPMNVSVDGTEVLTTRVDFPQFGPIATLDVRSKGLTDRKSSVEFSASGGVSKYDVTSGSSSLALAKTARESAEALDAAIIEIRYGRRLQALEKEVAIMEAERKLHPPVLDQLAEQLQKVTSLLQAMKGARGAAGELQADTESSGGSN